MKKAIMVLGCLILLFSGCGDSKADSCYSSGIEAIANGQYDEENSAFFVRTRIGRGGVE